MSSNFLDKSGMSYFWQKIKEMIQGKQDKLTAGTGITIDDNNVISASGGGGGGSSHNKDLYIYTLAQSSTTLGGEKVVLSDAGIQVTHANDYDWKLYAGNQTILLPTIDSTGSQPYLIMLNARLDAKDNYLHNCKIPAEVGTYDAESGFLTLTLKIEGTILYEKVSNGKITQYHTFNNQQVTIRTARVSVF